MSYQPGDEVQWQDPWMVDELGEDAAPWHAGTVVAPPEGHDHTYTEMVHITTTGPGLCLPARYVRSAPRLPLEGV